MRIFSAALAVAALATLAAPTMSHAQKGPQAFCLKTDSGSIDCLYATMAQCKAAMKGQNTNTCVKNPNPTAPTKG